MSYDRNTALLPTVSRSFTVAFAPRSGSNELCNLLARNGLGSPSEFFQVSSNDDVEASGLTEAARILSTIEKHTCNGVFGSKMAHDHRARVDRVLGQSLKNYNTIGDLLPDHRWIWLVRRDKIAQAVSLTRAEQSGVWLARSDAAPRPSEPEFDYHYILSRLMIVCVCDVAWQTYFQTNDIKPYVIYYEDFFSDIPSSLEALISHLGGAPCGYRSESADTTATLAVQRDETSAAWADRVRRYLNSVGGINMVAELGRAHERWERFFFARGWMG